MRMKNRTYLYILLSPLNEEKGYGTLNFQQRNFIISKYLIVATKHIS
ncbi:hypothetical protein J31TS3_26370 [Paenibacillus lactis]|nr:hypothetical protein J31TS3_26370 [Paenibacillus lactis]